MKQDNDRKSNEEKNRDANKFLCKNKQESVLQQVLHMVKLLV